MTSKRRGFGEGTIDARGPDSWRLRYRTADGKRHAATVSGSRTEAQRELRRLLKTVDDGIHIAPDKVTVAEFLDRWDRDWAANNLGAKTRERHQEVIRKQILPHVGSLEIQKLRPVILTELYAKLLREGRDDGSGLSARTVGHVHRLLHRAFGHAAQWDVIQQNIASLVRPPRVPSREIEIIREDQIRTVLETLRGRALYPIVALALATGMRRGELLALRWSDLDLNSAKLQVAQSLEQTKAGLKFKSPKTKHGRRTITLPGAAVAELRAHWTAQQQQRLSLGLSRANDGLVFATWDGNARSPNALTKEWSVASAAAGLKVTLHSLRHTHASSLIAAGVDILTISRRLGHASPTITLGVYGHLFSNTDDRAAQVMEAMFARVTE
jgi:integrase